MLYKVIKNIVQHVQSFQFHCTTAVVSCTIRTMLYTILYTRSLSRQAERACLACAAAPAPSRACLCSMHQRVPRHTIIMQITLLLCGARQAPAQARQRSQLERQRARGLVHQRSHAGAETVVGCWDRIASSCLSIFELLLPVQLAAVPAMVQMASSGCSSSKLASAPA
jgi:hypothetical protein